MEFTKAHTTHCDAPREGSQKEHSFVACHFKSVSQNHMAFPNDKPPLLLLMDEDEKPFGHVAFVT